VFFVSLWEFFISGSVSTTRSSNAFGLISCLYEYSDHFEVGMYEYSALPPTPPNLKSPDTKVIKGILDVIGV
jgi:hypothetical protein